MIKTSDKNKKQKIKMNQPKKLGLIKLHLAAVSSMLRHY